MFGYVKCFFRQYFLFCGKVLFDNQSVRVIHIHFIKSLFLLIGQFGTGRIHIVTFEIEYTMNTCFIVVFAIIGIRCKQAFERTFCRTERSRFIVVIDKVVGTSFTGISTVTAIIINHIIE